MSKVFDSIKHNRLFKKMENYGIRGLTLNWIKSYLTDRNIRVMFKNIISAKFDVMFGTPQASPSPIPIQWAARGRCAAALAQALL